MAETDAPDSRIDDPRWAGSESRLVAAIRDEILASADGRITFARFMERALTEPDVGYYAASELRPTRDGDFLTAPELHPLFGRCIGRFIMAARRAAGWPMPYRVHEYGAGRGTLRATASSGLDEGVEWSAIDLPGRTDSPPPLADLVLANEYLDALPVHRLLGGGELQEAWVGWTDGWFEEIVAAPSSPRLAAYLAANGITLAAGQRADVCLAAPAWLGRVAASLTATGIVLVIDYGHDAAELFGPRRMAGSLLTYRSHSVSDDFFGAVGRTDITAHVDITALERSAREAGLALVGSTTQAHFLVALGLGEMLADLGRQPDVDPAAYLEARSAVARLLDPQHLGAFRVLAWARPGADGAVPALPGFDGAP